MANTIALDGETCSCGPPTNFGSLAQRILQIQKHLLARTQVQVSLPRPNIVQTSTSVNCRTGARPNSSFQVKTRIIPKEGMKENTSMTVGLRCIPVYVIICYHHECDLKTLYGLFAISQLSESLVLINSDDTMQ